LHLSHRAALFLAMRNTARSRACSDPLSMEALLLAQI
jgi:hypothetical protein